MKYLLVIVSIFLFTRPTNANEFECLVEALYHEARSENDIGVLAVGTIILNRVKHKRFPNTICRVVHQGYYWKTNPIRNKCQFSYWCDGKTEKYKNIKSLFRIILLAEMLWDGAAIASLNKATHYHASYVRPMWSIKKQFKLITQKGRHLFYVDSR